MPKKRLKLKIDQIYYSDQIYPRTSLNYIHVEQLADAIKAGYKLPPIIIADVDGQKNVLIDGLHRIKAYLRVGIEEIECKWIGKLTLREAIVEAVRRNSAHGRSLSPFEKRAFIMKSKILGIKDDKIAEALRIPIEKVERLSISSISYLDVELEDRLNRKPIVQILYEHNVRNPLIEELMAYIPKKPLQRVAENLEASSMMQAQKSLAAMSQIHLLKQVIDLIDSNAIDLENPEVISLLRELHHKIEQFFRNLLIQKAVT